MRRQIKFYKKLNITNFLFISKNLFNYLHLFFTKPPNPAGTSLTQPPVLVRPSRNLSWNLRHLVHTNTSRRYGLLEIVEEFWLWRFIYHLAKTVVFHQRINRPIESVWNCVLTYWCLMVVWYWIWWEHTLRAGQISHNEWTVYYDNIHWSWILDPALVELNQCMFQVW